MTVPYYQGWWPKDAEANQLLGNSMAAAVMAPLLWQALPVIEREDWAKAAEPWRLSRSDQRAALLMLSRPAGPKDEHVGFERPQPKDR